MQKYIYLIILFLLLLGAATAGLFYVLRQRSDTGTSEVVLTLTAPESITSGDEVPFRISYRNATRTPLRGAEIFFNYPEGSVPVENPDQLVKTISLGDIQPGAGDTLTLSARLIGTKNSTLRPSAELTYRSAGGNATFRKKADTVVRIADTAFFLNFVVPQRAVSGEHIVYILNYENLVEQAFSDTRIRMRYPDGFEFSSAEPAPTDGTNTWDLGEVAGGGKGRIAVSGILSGTEGDTKKVKAEIGFMRQEQFFPYTENSFDTVISPSPLSVLVELTDNPDHIAIPGQTLGVRIWYQNNTEVALKEAVLRAQLDGAIFSLKGISADNGFYDSARNTIIWTPANVKQLSFLNPGEKHSVTFRAQLRDAFPISGTDDMNFTARITATIESINVPPYLALNKISSSDTLEVKLQTEPQFASAAFYRDESSGIVNSGPIPPKVNVQTLYTIHWRIAVPANDLQNVEVRATLPTGVVPTGQIVSRYTDAKPAFNETTGEVVWFIPKIPANTGITLPPYETIFQIAVTPSITQTDQFVELVRAPSLSSVDAFTGRTLNVSGQIIRSDQISDVGFDTRGGGRVAP